MPNMTMTRTAAQYKVLLILDRLSQGQCTMQRLAKDVAMTERWCKVYVNVLRDIDAIHICKWHRNLSGMPYYDLALGAGPDAPRPFAQTGAAKTEAYRRRKKKSGEWEVIVAKRTAKERAMRAGKRVHGWADAILSI